MTEELDWLEDRYIVINDYAMEDVVKAVNDYVAQGYAPYGELTLTNDGLWYQVILKE
jgi:hypothetical protein